LLDEETEFDVLDPGANGNLDMFTESDDIRESIREIDLSNPEAIWDLYSKDVRVSDKKVLDPFMGGGTSIGEASRFGAESTGYDINPVAWFISKKEMDAHKTDPEDLENAFQEIKEAAEDEIKQYYKTSCPNGDHETDVMYYLWVKEIDCVSCSNTVSLFEDYRVARGRYENKGKYNVYCPECESITLVDDWQSECACNNCSHEFIPKEGNVTRGGNYTCPHCGQKYGITDAIQEQDGYDQRLYALEYYCSTCDENGLSRGKFKAYKQVDAQDIRLFEDAKKKWNTRTDLHDYVPDQKIPKGALTVESSANGNDVFKHGYEMWTDMYSERQLLSLSIILKEIDKIENQNIKEFLLMALTGCLNRNNMMIGYNYAHNGVQAIFKSNSFDPPQRPAENNVWGLKHGAGPFYRKFELIKKGVEYAHAPTDRYVEDGETIETPKFKKPLGEDTNVFCDDLRNIDEEDKYDAVITDPPYYDNVLYSELSDFFYVWQKILLEDEYDCFSPDMTPRAEIVANPAQDKGAEEFETELREAFDVVHSALKKDGVLTFTYHHSDSESWGELLEALCDSGFVVTATYPVTADLQKLTKGEAVSFDIIVVARPATEREPISWNSLRRNIARTAKITREQLETGRDLSEGDIGVVEMGECFSEYSKHHGQVRKDREIMDAKEVVDEIYGIIQGDNDLGEIDVFLDLLSERKPTYNDLNKLCRGTNSTPDGLKDMQLFSLDGNELVLGTWNNEKRQAYVQNKIEEGNGDATSLDKAHFLRYRFEQGKSTSQYLERWDTDELQKLCKGLAEVTGDETYLKMVGVDTSLTDFEE
jgi:adenine-specific DNA methylase